MKVLYVIRHAKSSWDHPDKTDFDRPLNDRGTRDAPRMGKRLKEREVVPDLMLTSPAVRALATCRLIAEALNFPEVNIQQEKSLYHAGEETLLRIARQINDKHDCVFIFGHNPGLTDFVNSMMKPKSNPIDNLPTCGVAAFRFATDHWNDLRFRTGELLFFDFPKSKVD